MQQCRALCCSPGSEGPIRVLVLSGKARCARRCRHASSPSATLGPGDEGATLKTVDGVLAMATIQQQYRGCRFWIQAMQWLRCRQVWEQHYLYRRGRHTARSGCGPLTSGARSKLTLASCIVASREGKVHAPTRGVHRLGLGERMYNTNRGPNETDEGSG